MMSKDGYIYVLTNPSFPEYVKIGYADNVKTRVDQLNRSECTPFAFRIYATLHVANRLADKNIHKIIDKFKPELRAKENVNGKMRIREFFAMSAEEAVDLLETIGSIYGETPQVYELSAEEKKDEKIATDTAIASERRSPFSFYKCGIKYGEQLAFINDPNITCTVVGDRNINYDGEETSLSALAKKLLHKDSIQGTLYFTYKGEMLSALRKRLEDEGKYKSTDTDENFQSNTDENKSNVQDTSDLLYFTMNKYDAKCQIVKDGYLLLKGSYIASETSPKCKSNIKELREKYSFAISKDFSLIDNILFGSSSAAASFIAGTSLNGKLYWKDKNGVLLKELSK